MKFLIAFLVLPAAGLLDVGTGQPGSQRERSRPLHEALTPYSVGGLTEPRVTAAGGGAGGVPELVETPLLQRAVAAVAEVASRRGLLQIVKRLLDQADLPVRPAEALFVYLMGAVVGGALGLLLGNVFWGIAALAAVAVLPWMVLMGVAKHRTATFTAQLPDMLQLLGTTLRSGFSILQGLTRCPHSCRTPSARRCATWWPRPVWAGPSVDALNEVAQRVRSEDFEWVVTAIGIQREVGGNLAELLDIVADTMNARARLRREARTLTAEGRIGAVIISVLPIAIGAVRLRRQPGLHQPAAAPGVRRDPLLRFHRARGHRDLLGAQARGHRGLTCCPGRRRHLLHRFRARLRRGPQGRRAPERARHAHPAG